MPTVPDYTIVRASEGDVEGMIDLLAEVAIERLWLGVELPLDRPKLTLSLGSAIAREDALALVVVAGDKIVGLLTLVPERPGRLDLAITIAEPWRDKGVGRALMTQAIDWAREAKAYKIVLEVFPHNTRAIALYERMGFVREGLFRYHVRRKDGEIWDSLPMGLRLD